MIKKNETILYFHDFMTNEDDIRNEIDDFEDQFEKNGFEIGEIIETEEAPFEKFGSNKAYDILLFDWGGASMGNSIMRHYCQHILDEAIEKPSRYYIMVSSFTLEAMRELLYSIKNSGIEKPFNVFLTIEDYCNYEKSILK